MRRPLHPLAGKRVRIQLHKPEIDPAGLNGKEFVLEDWWVNIAGRSWMVCDGNPACLNYAVRSGLAHLPTDNEVVYGKVGAFGQLLHTSELGEVIES